MHILRYGRGRDKNKCCKSFIKRNLEKRKSVEDRITSLYTEFINIAFVFSVFSSVSDVNEVNIINLLCFYGNGVADTMGRILFNWIITHLVHHQKQNNIYLILSESKII